MSTTSAHASNASMTGLAWGCRSASGSDCLPRLRDRNVRVSGATGLAEAFAEFSSRDLMEASGRNRLAGSPSTGSTLMTRALEEGAFREELGCERYGNELTELDDAHTIEWLLGTGVLWQGNRSHE